ncbi:MAG: 2-phosphosulfolactate phosphatase [Gemmatimonadetes bacterium]|nr:2-phosphosulfolactate phosphatase [Gemmatimonadota bacterium]MDA1104233.1 2-phosphosulfolactate phosphatase [Gemmatimonadota bacterium]
MRIDTYFTLPEVDPASLTGATVVVIDVVRATTTIIEALANGARAIYPTASTEEAVRLASSMGREDTLLCGERRGHKVEGFDLGNSPREFTAEAVEGKKLVMSTTNGTKALGVGQEGGRVLPCAFTNLSAVAHAVRADEHIVVMCAGQEDRFSLDDALCAGHLIQLIVADDAEERAFNDSARAARTLAAARRPTRKFLSMTAGGAAVIRIDLADDLEICADVDRHDIVVVMSDQALVRSGG